jgi:hypothetical protein
MLPALFLFASLVTGVRGLIDRHDFAGAERTVRAYRGRTGATSELAAAGEQAAPAAEKQYIDQVRRRRYAALAEMPVPLSAANFLAYGASTTPTLILLDRAGVVRFYHPGAASEAELSARIQAILRE